ncbi:MAG: oligoendopeptidase F [Lachnospiraceae bacterium]
MRTRDEVPREFTWNLEDILPSDEAWEELWEQVKQELTAYPSFRGTLGQSAKRLLECLEFDEGVSQKIEVLYVYARQKLDQDTGNQKYQGYFGRAQSLSFEASELSSFLVPEIMEIPEEILASYMASDQGLVRYQRLMEQLLKKKPHTLDGAMEELLAQSLEATQGASQIFSMFNNADVQFPKIQGEDGEMISITHGNYIALLESSDRRVRRDAFQALYSVYRQFSNTLAATFASNVKQAGFYAKARHYASGRAHSLAENEIPETVYDNLIASVREALPSLHRYVALRKKLLKLDEIHMYDLYTPIVSQVKKTIPYETAKEMVLDGLAPLGEEYLSLLREGFANRWIDVYENKGKRSGAYSWGAYGSHPYVLLNYNDTLDHVFTLAHEMGHALHSYYSDSAQPYTYAGYKIFVAEVASTCNEALLLQHLLSKAESREEKAYLVNHFLESFRGTLFRQTMFAEFEAMAHKKAEEGETLTSQTLNQWYHQLNVDYFGSEMVVDEEIDCEWSRIPHFYTPFYVYQYATGFSAAIFISRRILAGDQEVLEGYRSFLKGGCSKTPIELLKLCKVDMSRPEPVKEALAMFDDLLDQMEAWMTE